MNYSYHWCYNVIVCKEIRELIVKEIKMFIELNKNIRLKGLHEKRCFCLDYYRPIINTETIFFNGLDEPGDAFIFHFDHIQKNGVCNTHKKPYDLLVKLTLLSMSNHMLNFKFSTDETYDEWKYAIQLYTNYIGNLNLDFDNHEFRSISSEFV